MKTNSLIIPSSIILISFTLQAVPLELNAQPRIVVEPDSLFVEAEQWGDWDGNDLMLNVDEFNVFNRGNQRLDVDSIRCDWEGEVWFDAESFSLNAGQSQEVAFGMIAPIYLESMGQEFNFSFQIYSNDPEVACLTIPVNLFAWHGQDWGPWAYSPVQHRVILTGIEIDGEQAPRGCVITFITDDDQWAGGGTWLGHESLLAAYGDFEFNEDFYEQGDQIRFQLFDPLSKLFYDPTVNLEEGELRFADDGYTAVSLSFERRPFHILTITDVSFNDEPMPNGWDVVVRTRQGVECTSGYWRNGRHLELVAYGEVEEYPGYFRPGEQMRFHVYDWRNRLEYPAIAVIEDGGLEFENEASSVLSLHFDNQPFHTLRVTTVSINDSAALNGTRIGIFTPDGVYAGGMTWRDEQLDISAWGANDNLPELLNDADSFTIRIFDPYTDRELATVLEVEEGPLQWHEGGLTVLSLAGYSHFEHRIPLRQGWNLLSSFCPPDNPAMPTVWAEVVGRGNLILTKNQSGQFYLPEVYNGMAPWDVRQGYMAKVAEIDTLVIVNVPTDVTTPIPFRQGWNLAAYFPEEELDVRDAFTSIQDNLIMVKDSNGRFYRAQIGFSNMEPLSRGNGYQVAVSEACELVYPEGQMMMSDDDGDDDGDADDEMEHFQPAKMTGANMSVLVTALIPAEAGIQTGGIGVFSQSGLCVGAGVFASPTKSGEAISQPNPGQIASIRSQRRSQLGIAVWADDPTTPEIDGAVEGEALSFRLWGGVVESSVVPTAVGTTAILFETDGFAEVTLDVRAQGLAPLPTVLALHTAYPNPFNSTTLIRYDLPESSVVSLTVTDLNGREVADLSTGRDAYRTAGSHSVVWSAENHPSGVYLVKLVTPLGVKTSKIALIR